MNIFRHGDIPLISIKKADITKLKKIEYKSKFVLREGETTGHKHVLDAPKTKVDIYQDAQGRYIMNLKGEATVSHEEHGTILLPAGWYVAGFERERDWFAESTNRVLD